MEQINEAISRNIKSIREQRRLSLDNLAKLTGVSKSMLGQIERGDVNPTVSIVWKIAGGLKVPFSELVTLPNPELDLVSKDDIVALLADGDKYRNWPLFPFDSERRFELCYIELDPEALLEAEAHPAGTIEVITVFDGELEVRVSGRELVAVEGCALRFRADVPHSYHNPGTRLCRISMLLSYSPDAA